MCVLRVAILERKTLACPCIAFLRKNRLCWLKALELKDDDVRYDLKLSQGNWYVYRGIVATNVEERPYELQTVQQDVLQVCQCHFIRQNSAWRPQCLRS